MNNKLGVMQGRLLPQINGRFQSFPIELWETEFPLAKEAGLDAIEFIFENEDCMAHPLMNQEGLDRIKALQKETGIHIYSVCADYFMEFPMHHEAHTENSIEVLKLLIQNCSQLPIKDIVVPCVDQSTIANEEEMDRFVSSIKACVPIAEQYGINLNFETDLDPNRFTQLLSNFSSPNIKVNYDIGNSAALGYKVDEEFQAYGSYLSDVHIKDRVFQGTTVPLGEGDADIPKTFSLLKEMQFDGIFILQAARKVEGEELETIKEYVQQVKQYLN